jgi:methylmalonyl-CoA epimerase
MAKATPFKKIAHIGIAVEDLESALVVWRDRLGLEPEAVTEMIDRGLKIAFFPVGESLIELIAPLGPDSEVSRFLEKRGSGVHHICFAVDDIHERLRTYRAQGLRPTSDEPSVGAEGCPVAFLHPKETGGVLIELLQENDAT